MLKVRILFVLCIFISLALREVQGDVESDEPVKEVEEKQEEAPRDQDQDLVATPSIPNPYSINNNLPDVSPENKLDFIRFFAGLYYQNSYRHINHFLVDNVESDEIGPNLLAATKLYEKEKQDRWNIFNKHLVGALQQFISLNRIVNGEKCTKNSYAILLKNDRATRGRTHKIPSRLGILTRVDKIIYSIAINHAIECQTVYPELFKQRYSQLDKEKVEKVETFMNDIINHLMTEKKNFFRETKKYETVEQLQHVRSIHGKRKAQVAYDAIKLFASGDPDVKYLRKVVDEKEGILKVKKDKVVGLFTRYLVEPCEYYVRELGPNIFIPASYDIVMLEKEDRYSQDDKKSDFFLSWTRYRLCNLLIGKDKQSLISAVIKIADKEP